MAASKLTGEERKLAIIEAAVPVFSRNGFNGTSIKKIASAANISEALIYKHFSGKDELYRDMLSSCAGRSVNFLQGFRRLEPGTQTLVRFVYSTVLQIVLGKDKNNRFLDRLLFYCLLEDPDIVRSVYRKLTEEFTDVIDKSVEIALNNGDIVSSSALPRFSFWFINHLALAIKMFHQLEKPAFEYDATKEELVKEAILFALRGMGITDAAIHKYFKPEELDEFIRQFNRQPD